MAPMYAWDLGVTDVPSFTVLLLEYLTDASLHTLGSF
jgi:hypothetical protein